MLLMWSLEVSVVCAPAPPELAEKLDGRIEDVISYCTVSSQIQVSLTSANLPYIAGGCLELCTSDCISNRSLELMCAQRQEGLPIWVVGWTGSAPHEMVTLELR